ncbi:HutD/Ves family protein [Acidaminococcus fermentans]|uniref:HutD/Ves family protein n=1 Tax=Acidaminococcus fermentans TaxID=905 RepID=UPI00242ACEAA|nr:HutD family protein [Acidaminococcus fermentans]MDD6287539.1 HutD family protein [Acidaminococcus fermentans]
MDILKRSRSQAVTTRWSGGTTTEFYIDPPGSAYARRDFLIRISSATVDLEASDFTLLPDYNRIILPLRGGFTLTFPEDGNRQVTLGPLEQASFDGAWHTHSVGKAVDFNVMVRKGLSASCEKIAGSRPLPPAPRRFVYVPFWTEAQLKGATLDGKPLDQDTLYVLPPEGTGELVLPEGVAVLYIVVK